MVSVPKLLEINSILDIEKLKDNEDIMYLALSIDNYEEEVVEYLKEHGQKYFFSDFSNTAKGYNYVDYDVFVQAETVIDTIIKKMPSDLNEFEKARYLYISLGKKVSLSYEEEVSDYGNKNIWWAILEGKATNTTLCKIYLYLCAKVKVKCQVVSKNDSGYKTNLLTVDDNTNLIIDLGKDIPYIKTSFQTKHFGLSNNIPSVDRKIHYITKEYTDEIIKEVIQKSNFSGDKILQKILVIIQTVIDFSLMNIDEIKVILESVLNVIYKSILDLEENIQKTNIEINMKDIIINNNKTILINSDLIYYYFDISNMEFKSISEEYLERQVIYGNITILESENKKGAILG